MTIKFTKSAGGHNIGDIIEIEDRHAETLISMQFAVLVEAEPQPEPEREKIEPLKTKQPEKIEGKPRTRKPVKR